MCLSVWKMGIMYIQHIFRMYREKSVTKEETKKKDNNIIRKMCFHMENTDSLLFFSFV